MNRAIVTLAVLLGLVVGLGLHANADGTNGFSLIIQNGGKSKGGAVTLNCDGTTTTCTLSGGIATVAAIQPTGGAMGGASNCPMAIEVPYVLSAGVLTCDAGLEYNGVAASNPTLSVSSPALHGGEIGITVQAGSNNNRQFEVITDGNDLFFKNNSSNTGVFHISNSSNTNMLTVNYGTGNGVFAGSSTAEGAISNGTKFTISGCSAGTTVGGATAGSFLSGTTGACTVVITMNGATGLTAPNGWSCHAADLTTPANLISQSASSTTTCTVTGTTFTGDTIQFLAIGF